MVLILIFRITAKATTRRNTKNVSVPSERKQFASYDPIISFWAVKKE
jgi:hypothetical protein